MGIIIPAAIITAVVILYILSSMFCAKCKKTRQRAMVIGLCMALPTILIYAFIGKSDLPAQAALFETGQRADIRDMMHMEQDFETAYKLKPDNMSLALRLSDIKLQLGKINEAVEILEATINFYPDNLEAKEMLGSILFGIGMMIKSKGASAEEIIDVWDRAKEIAPKDASFLKALERQKSLLTPKK